MGKEKICGISFNSKSDVDTSFVAEIRKMELMKSCSPSEYANFYKHKLNKKRDIASSLPMKIVIVRKPSW